MVALSCVFLLATAFLYAAVEYAPELIDECIRNRVLIATPTTLIALLKTIEFGWRQQQMAENAEQIRSLGSDLYGPDTAGSSELFAEARYLLEQDHIATVAS